MTAAIEWDRERYDAPPTDLDRARRAVDALGGTWPVPRDEYEKGYQAGFNLALDAAIEAIEKLGGVDRYDI